MISWAEAEIKAEEAIDRVTESFDENGKTLDINTKKGRENKQAFIDAAQAAAEAAQKRAEETGSISAGLETYNAYIAKLRAALVQQGLTKKQIDELIDAYARMPTLVATTITANTAGLDAAISKMRQLQNMARDARIDFATRNRWGGVYEGRRWGGVTVHAQSGALREATIASPSSVARYSWAEPATGGEAFVPKNGDYGRSMSILSKAAGWYGASVVPGGMASTVMMGAPAASQTIIVQLIDPMSGKVLRQAAINDATSRGVAPDKIRAAYP